MENSSKWERIVAALYFIWFFLHLGLLFYAGESPDNSLFWPFYSSNKTLENTYDITEFIVYAGSPLILLIAYKIVYDKNYENSSSGRRHSSASFFIAFLDEKIKTEELTQKVNELENKPVNYDHLNQLKADRKKADSHSINDWLDKIEIKKKYKEFEG